MPLQDQVLFGEALGEGSAGAAPRVRIGSPAALCGCYCFTARGAEVRPQDAPLFPLRAWAGAGSSDPRARLEMPGTTWTPQLLLGKLGSTHRKGLPEEGWTQGILCPTESWDRKPAGRTQTEVSLSIKPRPVCRP